MTEIARFVRPSSAGASRAPPVGSSARERLAAVLDAIDALGAAPDVKTVERTLLPVLARFGVEGYGSERILGPGGKILGTPLFPKSYISWRDHYWSRGHVWRDPLIVRSLTGTGTMVWQQVLREPLTPGAILVFNEAREYGYADGFVTPMHRADGSLTTALFSSPRPLDLALEDEASLRLLALYLANVGERLDLAGGSQRLSAGSGRPVRRKAVLTQRQKDCLEWLRDGRTYWEIGQILQISERTVKFHVQEACRALGVRTRQQALVEASVAGLLGPGSGRAEDGE
jgi:LuxR family transcriptional regulator, quorum-sensing system regulator BjaR1